jgi:ankyrin repeat protein
VSRVSARSIAAFGLALVLLATGCRGGRNTNRPDESLRLLVGKPWQVTTKASTKTETFPAQHDGDVLYIEGDRYFYLDGAGKVVDQGGFETPGGKRVRLRNSDGLGDFVTVELTPDRAALKGSLTIMGGLLQVEIGLSPSSVPVHLPTPSSLHEAAELGDVSAIRRFVSTGSNIDELVDGVSPLMLAAYHCHPSAVQELLMDGARTDLVSGNGKSALILAVESGDAEVVRFLLAKKADVGFRGGKNKASPIVIAVGNGDLEVSRLLVDAGADLRDKDQYGNPLLCVATMGGFQEGGHPDVVKFLLEKKLDPNQGGMGVSTPLMNAVMNHAPQVVRLLLDHGADPKKAAPADHPLAEYAEYAEHAGNSPDILKLVGAIGSEDTALAADPSAAKALGQCKTIDCLRTTIPEEKGKLLAAIGCKVVEGRKDPRDVDLELGSVCRVLVARARAAFRGVAPCVKREGIQPNWDPDLDKMYELDLENLQLAETLFKRRGIKLNRDGHPIDGVPRFGIPAFHRIARSGDRFVELATYYCIADSPRRYVPFYYSLRIGDEIGEGQIVEEQVVNQPDAIPVLLQSRQFHHDDDIRVFVLADLNGDKKQDIAIVRHKPEANQYYLAACLFNRRGSDCIPVVTHQPINVDSSPGNMHLEAEKGGTLRLWATGFADEIIGQWRFHMVGSELKSVDK